MTRFSALGAAAFAILVVGACSGPVRPLGPVAAPALQAPADAGEARIVVLQEGVAPVTISLAEGPVETATAPDVAVSSLQPAEPRVLSATPAVALVPQTTGAKFATGPIYAACRSSGRDAASAARCGCVQWVADRSLSASDQKRGAGYFQAKQALQDVRQSDRAANARFWDTWTSFGENAAQQCRET